MNLRQAIGSKFRNLQLTALISVGLAIALAAPVWAVNPPNPSGSMGLEATIPAPAPTAAATIATPISGSVSSTPITVSGLCSKGLLVKIFSNGVFVGSVNCANGSYSLPVDLFTGTNQLIARQYDALDQASPDSNAPTVTFVDGQYAQFGPHISLTSDYAEKGAAPGSELSWPISLSNGKGPYAVSVDWGDATASDLFTVVGTGTFVIKHVYKSAGIYQVLVRVTDANGQAAFLQLVGQGTGAIQDNPASSPTTKLASGREIIWWPILFTIPLIVLAFWVGRRHQMAELRHHQNRYR